MICYSRLVVQGNQSSVRHLMRAVTSGHSPVNIIIFSLSCFRTPPIWSLIYNVSCHNMGYFRYTIRILFSLFYQFNMKHPIPRMTSPRLSDAIFCIIVLIIIIIIYILATD